MSAAAEQAAKRDPAAEMARLTELAKSDTWSAILGMARDCVADLLENSHDGEDLAITAGTSFETWSYNAEPMQGDWEALREMLGREPTDDEKRDFTRHYRDLLWEALPVVADEDEERFGEEVAS